MKPYQYIVSFLLLCTVTVSAQKQRAYEMTVSGVKVIVQPSNNELVEIQTVFKGGVQNYPAAKAGIESLAMSALVECGTITLDKNGFKNKLDKVNAYVYGNAGMDFSTLTMNCIKDDFNSVWPLYAEALTQPRFDSKEFERIKQDAINNLKAQASQPDYAIQKLAKETAFKGMDYAKSPSGTETTVSKLTAQETKDYYRSILSKNRMFIVVVGEIDKETLKKNIEAMLSTVPEGGAFAIKKQMYAPVKNSFLAQKKDLATNYIQAVTGAPLPGTEDFNSFNIAMRIFYDRHFLEVRTKNGLSYAPQTYFDGGLYPSANMVVSTTEPNKYIAVVKNLLNNTKQKGFTEEEVKNMKTTYLTGFYYRQETNSAQASSLAANEALHNNWKRALTLNDDVKKITAADVSKAFNKYIANMTWVYQGDPTKANPQAFTGNPSPAKKPDAKLKGAKTNQ